VIHAFDAVPDAPRAGPRPWRRALAWLALLGPFFFLTYGWANGLAAAQPDVPSVMFDWERALPFWAWTIVPYWSIDAFYAFSLWLCLDRRELDRHALRLFTAQVVSVSCFVLWPLRVAFERPPTEGVFGWMFDVLLGFDKPFNQAPSLHIVLLVLIWLRFGAHLRQGWQRWLLHVWAVLIGLSVLTTYQHQFLDIPTGMLAGFLCAWLWPMRLAPPWRGARLARDPARWRLAAYYATGALACVASAWTLRGGALWLLWPAVSLALVAANYAAFGAAGFQKHADGSMSVAAQWLYAPYLAGAWINSRLWTRRAPAPVEVADGVWLGRLPAPADLARFDAVVDVCAELPAPRAAIALSAVPMLDLVAPSPERLREAAQAIERARSGAPRVLVCCALGYSRSALAIAAWLLASRRTGDAESAIARVRVARPAIVLGPAHRRVLEDASTGPVPATPLGEPA
jgi:protein-tyrosine phosphatase/membrane-associated phospholipid phosphatase